MIIGLDRINELARKQKRIGLTDEERVEQQQLREDYMRQFPRTGARQPRRPHGHRPAR